MGTSGFQLLHCIHLVEQFLLNLIRRRCRFSVVFFNGDEPPWSSLLNVDFQNVSASSLSDSVETMSARRLARKLVIQHIGTALLSTIELHVYPTFNCPEFQSYIAKYLVLSPTLLN
jgi:hypothetical protein